MKVKTTGWQTSVRMNCFALLLSMAMGCSFLRAADDTNHLLQAEWANSLFNRVNGQSSFNAFYAGEKLALELKLQGGTPTEGVKFISIDAADTWLPPGMTADPVFHRVIPVAKLSAPEGIPITVKDRLGAWKISCRALDKDKQDISIVATTELAVVRPSVKPDRPQESYFGICDVY